jgi:hypothetical protein
MQRLLVGCRRRRSAERGQAGLRSDDESDCAGGAREAVEGQRGRQRSDAGRHQSAASSAEGAPDRQAAATRRETDADAPRTLLLSLSPATPSAMIASAWNAQRATQRPRPSSASARRSCGRRLMRIGDRGEGQGSLCNQSMLSSRAGCARR